MKPLKTFFVIVGAVILGIVAIILYSGERKVLVPQQGITITTSFYPLAYLAAQVGGPHVFVNNLLPSGGEPHDYEPSTRQLAEVGQSALFIYNGAQFEPWVEKWQTGSFAKPAKVINMVDELGRRGAPLISQDGSIDPHIWLDPQLYAQEVEIIRDALIEIDPAHADEYRTDAEMMIGETNALDQHFRQGLQVCEQRYVVVSHEAFGYLAQRYGFNAIAIAGISPDEEPSPKALADLATLARAKGIHYVFFETTASPRLSETIAREIGAQTLVLNPLESLTASELQSGEHYGTIMEKNLTNLRKALVCQ